MNLRLRAVHPLGRGDRRSRGDTHQIRDRLAIGAAVGALVMAAACGWRPTGAYEPGANAGLDSELAKTLHAALPHTQCEQSRRALSSLIIQSVRATNAARVSVRDLETKMDEVRQCVAQTRANRQPATNVPP